MLKNDLSLKKVSDWQHVKDGLPAQGHTCVVADADGEMHLAFLSLCDGFLAHEGMHDVIHNVVWWWPIPPQKRTNEHITSE